MNANVARIHIDLNTDRDLIGNVTVSLIDERVIIGPFPVAARAADSIAANNGNPTRESVFPFGDPPTGAYRASEVVATGVGTPYRADLYGHRGAIVLLPVSGDAALADACGRFHILIHGGPPSADGRLRVSSGHFRVQDDHLETLMRFVSEACGRAVVICSERSTSGNEPVSLDLDDDQLILAETEPAVAAPKAVRLERSRNLVAFGEYVPDVPGGPEDIIDGQVSVDSSDDTDTIYEQISDTAGNTARDLTLELANTATGGGVPGDALNWTEVLSEVAGTIAGAGEMAMNGQTGAAVDAVLSSLREIVPDAIGNAVAIELAAPTIVEATVAVGVGAAALGVELSVVGIGVTAVVVAVGIGTVANMAGDAVADLAKRVISDASP